MLQQTDRLALAVPNADQAASGLNAIFDSVVVADTVDTDANARRITLQWGCDQLELFEPKGPGALRRLNRERAAVGPVRRPKEERPRLRHDAAGAAAGAAGVAVPRRP